MDVFIKRGFFKLDIEVEKVGVQDEKMVDVQHENDKRDGEDDANKEKGNDMDLDNMAHKTMHLNIGSHSSSTPPGQGGGSKSAGNQACSSPPFKVGSIEIPMGNEGMDDPSSIEIDVGSVLGSPPGAVLAAASGSSSVTRSPSSCSTPACVDAMVVEKVAVQTCTSPHVTRRQEGPELVSVSKSQGIPATVGMHAAGTMTVGIAQPLHTLSSADGEVASRPAGGAPGMVQRSCAPPTQPLTRNIQSPNSVAYGAKKGLIVPSPTRMEMEGQYSVFNSNHEKLVSKLDNQPAGPQKSAPTIEEVIAFGGIPVPAARTSMRIQGQLHADATQMERAMRITHAHNNMGGSGYPYGGSLGAALSVPSSSRPAGYYGYWVQPFADGRPPHIQPVVLAAA